MATLLRLCFMLFCVQLLLCGQLGSPRQVAAQLIIDASTPSSRTDGTPNTLIGVVGSTIASALLDADTNVMLWGMVPSASVNEVCAQIRDTGIDTVTATVNHNWGDGPETLTFNVLVAGGCLAAEDGSGTEIVSVDEYQHKSAIICPEEAGKTGCSIWISGPDVDGILNNDDTTNEIRTTNRNLLDDGSDGCFGGGVAGLGAGFVVGLKIGDVLCDGGNGTINLITLLPETVCYGVVTLVSVVVGGLIGCLVGCFPGDALVQLQDGQSLAIMHLEVGHKVAVWEPSRFRSQIAISYDEVYALGHKDAFTRSPFYRITMQPHNPYQSQLDNAVVLDSYLHTKNSTRTLEISAQHFLPTMQSTDTSGKFQVVYKKAKDIKIGGYLWAATDLDDTIQPHIVTSIATVYKKGLYNPLTLGGSIVVNGVVASVHSDWFLDNIFDKLGLPSSTLPYAYQTVLAPPRMLYRMWPTEWYKAVYNWMDIHLNVAEWYGSVATGISLAGFVSGFLCRRKYK